MKTVEEELTEIFGTPNEDGSPLVQWGDNERKIWFNKRSDNEWQFFTMPIGCCEPTSVFMDKNGLSRFILDFGDVLRRQCPISPHKLLELEKDYGVKRDSLAGHDFIMPKRKAYTFSLLDLTHVETGWLPGDESSADEDYMPPYRFSPGRVVETGGHDFLQKYGVQLKARAHNLITHFSSETPGSPEDDTSSSESINW